MAFDDGIAESRFSEGGNEKARKCRVGKVWSECSLNYIFNFITGSVSLFFGQSAACVLLSTRCGGAN